MNCVCLSYGEINDELSKRLMKWHILKKEDIGFNWARQGPFQNAGNHLNTYDHEVSSVVNIIYIF